jgi:hypothetical protein
MIRYSLIAILAVAGTTNASPQDLTKINGPIIVTGGQHLGNVSTVNGRVDVTSGQTLGNISTVNGAIRVADRDVIGNAHTVNGRITLGTDSAAQSLSTINGSITVGTGDHASAIRTVNGTIVLDRSADVSGHVVTVNGRIRLDNAHVGNGIESVSGDIDIGARSKVEGGVLVKARTGLWFPSCQSRFWKMLFPSNCEPPLVVIGPGSIVEGSLRFERPVKLYVSTSARIGVVQGATAILYSGERPPS